jgi:hypothetical protein
MRRKLQFRGKEPIRSKICINNKTLKQQNTFNYLGYNLSYEAEKDMNIKAANFVKVLVSRHTRIRTYKTQARPVLSYGNKAWAIRTDEKI